MTRFDEAPSFDADGWRWLRPIGRHPVPFIAAIVALALVAGVAVAFLFAAEAGRAQVARLIAGTQYAVVLGPQVARADAEAMRGGLESLPLVETARLQTREQALTRLTGSSGLVAGSRANPIPDVWVLSVRRPESDAALRTFAEDRSGLEQKLAAMPGVASVRVDAEWLRFVDHWAAVALRTLPVVHALTLGVLAAIAFCIAFLAGRVFRAGPEPGVGAGPAALVGALAGIFALGLVVALVATLGNVVGSAAIEWAGLQQTLRIGIDSPLAALAGTVLGATVLGITLGAMR